MHVESLGTTHETLITYFTSVRNAFAVIAGGVSLTITPLLSLSADQVNKLQSADQSHGPVVLLVLLLSQA